MPRIDSNYKVVIRDEGKPTIKAIAEALELAVKQGAPVNAELTLQEHVNGWVVVVRWEPSPRS